VDAGAELREGVRARLGPGTGEVILEGVGTVRAGVILDATGLSGAFSGVAHPRRGSLLGAGAMLDGGPVPPGIVRMACAPGGYVGMVRADAGRCVVAAALAPRLVAREGSLGAAIASILAACGLPPLPPDAPWRGTPPLTRRPARPWRERVLVVGDAAGYVEPFTGEGMSWAISSGLVAADLAAEGWTPSSGPRWERTHKRIVGRRQRRCRALALVLRAPRLVRAAVRILGVAPVFARPFVRAAAGSVR
jgi:2-polyprenyl-6-methoxyphenol hydroxylase-like FAD-dependent oxidoreductase